MIKVAIYLYILVLCLGVTPLFADPLSGPDSYAMQENRRVLSEIIATAQEALNSIDDPNAAKDDRALRNRRTRGQPRIVNGRGTIEYTAVGELLHLSVEDNREQSWCTGTLVAPDKFLTAAHCIAKEPDSSKYRVFFQNAGFFDVKEILWQPGKFKFPNADIAILHLTAVVPFIKPEQILSDTNVIPGTRGTIVGFGRTGGFQEDYGVKREGFIETSKCPIDQSNNHVLCWNFSTEVEAGEIRSNTCNADSGGPLFVYDTVMGHEVRYIAGVTSGGDAEDCLLGDQSYDADVLFYSDWIKATAEIEQGHKPESTQFLNTSTDVRGMTVALNEKRSTVATTFGIASGVKKILVSLNGDDNGRQQNLYSFQLSDQAGTLCPPSKAGVFAFCAVDVPADDQLSVTVNLIKGRGNVQVVVTELR